MKRHLRLLVFLVFGGLAALSAERAYCQQTVTGVELVNINNVLIPFLNAMKDGDVSTLKGLMSEEMYRDYRVLLEENKDYPQFLREFYRGATFKTVSVTRKSGQSDSPDTFAGIEIEFPDQRVVPIEIPLVRKKSTEEWKVASPKEGKESRPNGKQ